MNKYTKKDLFLETPLDLNGEIFFLENGYWKEKEIRRTENKLGS